MKGFTLIFETVFSKKGFKPNDWFPIFDKKEKCDRYPWNFDAEGI